MGKFRMTLWGEGPTMECTQHEGELEVETANAAKKRAEEIVERLKQTYPVFDFGVTKLTQITDSGEEKDILL